LPLRILADENVDFRIITTLRQHGFQVISVLEEFRGISNGEVLNLAREHKAFLITEDSDFGEWIFASHERNIGVIFLRYREQEIQNIADALIDVLRKHDLSLSNRFVVITPKKTRIREL